MKPITRAIARLEKFVDKAWYLPTAAALLALDLFVAVIPSDGLVISSILLRRKRWISTFLWMAGGSGTGALLLSTVTRLASGPLLAWLPHENTGSWAQTAAWIDHYGLFALAFIAAGPIPQQPAVALCGLAHVHPAAVFAAVFAGRSLKYGFYGWTIVHAPHLLRRLKGPAAEIREISNEARKKPRKKTAQ